MTIKWHYKSILIPLQTLQQILWTCCIFLSSMNYTFFSVLVIIFSNMNYLCFNYTKTFFIHTMNYFSVVLRICFSNVYWELFFHWAKNYFSQYCEFILGPTMLCGPCSRSWLARVFDFLGQPFWKLWSGGLQNIVRERNKRGFHLFYKIGQEPVVWVFVMRFSGPKI